MDNDVDFDGLVQKTIASNNARSDLDTLYGAVFSLESWHFIARGELPNVFPYVASNAEYVDNLPTARAFTDTGRLLRFAKENNLTDASGEAPVLSIPTDKVVEYLEQFISRGVHAVWFNSDTQSIGFFAPLKQLRIIKEHLEKANLINRARSTAPANPTGPSAGEAVDIELSLFQKGEVSFDTAIGAFYQAVFPLLQDYRGSGAYTDILSLDGNRMHEKVENIASNSHGACLRVRRFLYPGDDGRGIGINTIDSSALQHTKVRSALLVNFALLKDIARQTAAFYYRFQGPKSEVSSLAAAIRPCLEGCNFKASSQ